MKKTLNCAHHMWSFLASALRSFPPSLFAYSRCVTSVMNTEQGRELRKSGFLMYFELYATPLSLCLAGRSG